MFANLSGFDNTLKSVYLIVCHLDGHGLFAERGSSCWQGLEYLLKIELDEGMLNIVDGIVGNVEMF